MNDCQKQNRFDVLASDVSSSSKRLANLCYSSKDRLNRDLLEQIRRDREGERIEQNLVQGVISSLRTHLP